MKNQIYAFQSHFLTESIKPGNAEVAIETEMKAILLSLKLFKGGKFVSFTAHLPEVFTMLIQLHKEKLVILKAAESHFAFTEVGQSVANTDTLHSVMWNYKSAGHIHMCPSRKIVNQHVKQLLRRECYMSQEKAGSCSSW